MTVTQSVPIRAGHLQGSACWDHRQQTFVAALRLFDRQQTYPPPLALHGIRTGEFLTVDALANHLAGIGMALDAHSRSELHQLAAHVASNEGTAEVVGLTDPGGERHIVMVTPSRLMLPLNPRIAHQDHRFQWGDGGPATVETARLICEQVWMRGLADDSEIFATALAMEHLAPAGPDFSFSASGLCDWYLTDTRPPTTLGGDDLTVLRRRLQLLMTVRSSAAN